MFILRIEHPVRDFNGWKEIFDSDPVRRQESGVRRYRILRPVDNENFVMIDLEFDTRGQAEALLGELRKVWSNVEGKIVMNPQVRITQTIETGEY